MSQPNCRIRRDTKRLAALQNSIGYICSIFRNHYKATSLFVMRRILLFGYRILYTILHQSAKYQARRNYILHTNKTLLIVPTIKATIVRVAVHQRELCYYHLQEKENVQAGDCRRNPSKPLRTYSGLESRRRRLATVLNCRIWQTRKPWRWMSVDMSRSG